jgi:hypothetical protein
MNCEAAEAPGVRHLRLGEYRYMKTLEDVIQIKNEVEDDLLMLPGVTGVGVSDRAVEENQTREYVIRIYVDDKAEAIRRSHLPGEIRGVPVEVIERRFDLLNKK